MSSQKHGSIQVTYIHSSRTPLPAPPKEVDSQQSNTEEEGSTLSEAEYIKLIEDERAKYAEAKKTISKLVNKLQNDQENIQQERVDNRGKIAALQSIYQSKIEDLLEQLQNHKEVRETEQRERLEMLEELSNEMNLLEKESESTKQQLMEERAANSQLLVAMQEEVANVQRQMETMRVEVNTSENVRKANDANTLKLNAIEESVKQVMEFCIKEMQIQVRRSLEDSTFYSTKEKLQAQIDEERKSRSFILMMDDAELKNILEKEQGVLHEETERLGQEEKKKTDMGVRVRHMLDCHSSTKRELEAVKQKREMAEALLIQLQNEAKNLEEMTNMLSTTPPSDSFDLDSSKDDSTDSLGSSIVIEKWSARSSEPDQYGAQLIVSPKGSGALHAELACQMKSTSIGPPSSRPNSPPLATSTTTSSASAQPINIQPSPPSPNAAPKAFNRTTTSRTLSSKSSPALTHGPKLSSPSTVLQTSASSYIPSACAIDQSNSLGLTHKPPSPPRGPPSPSPSPRGSPRSFTSAMKSIFQKEKDNGKAVVASSRDLHLEQSSGHGPDTATDATSRTESAPQGPIVNHAMLAAQLTKRGASWAAAPSPPLGFGSTTNLPILKLRARSTLTPATSTAPEVQLLRSKFETLSSVVASPQIHPKIVPPVSLMSKLGLSKTSWPDSSGSQHSPRSPRTADATNGSAEGSPQDEGSARTRASSVSMLKKDATPIPGNSTALEQSVIARRRSNSASVTVPGRSSPPTVPNQPGSTVAAPVEGCAVAQQSQAQAQPQVQAQAQEHTSTTHESTQGPTAILHKSQSVTQVVEYASKDQAEASQPGDALQTSPSLRTSRSAPHVQGKKSTKDKQSTADKHRSIARVFNLGNKISDDYVEVHSAVEDYTWNLKIDSDTTAKIVCSKLAQKLDSNFDNFELHLYVGKIKRVLIGHERIIDVRSKLGKDWQKCSLKLYYRLPGSTSSSVALPSGLNSSSEASPFSSPTSLSPISSPPVNSPIVISPPISPDQPSPPLSRKSRHRTVSSPNNTPKKSNAERRSLRKQSTHSDSPSMPSEPSSRRESIRSPLQYFFSKGESSSKRSALPDLFAPPEVIPAPTSAIASISSPYSSFSSFSPPRTVSKQDIHADLEPGIHNPPELSASNALPRTQSTPLSTSTDLIVSVRKRSVSNVDQHQFIAAQVTNAQHTTHPPDSTLSHYPSDNYIKIDSLVRPERDGWRVRLDKPTTVDQVCKKMATTLAKSGNSFELYEVQGSNRKLLLGTQYIRDIIASWGNNQKSFGLLYVETSETLESIDTTKFGEYISVQSMVEGNTWRVKLEARDTVEDVCRRLSKKIDEKYKIVELYIIGSKEPLQGDHNMLDVLQGLETSQRKFGLLYKIDASDNDTRFSYSSSQLKPGEIVEDSPRLPLFSPSRESAENGSFSGDFIDSDILKKIATLPSRPSIIVEVFRIVWITSDSSIYLFDREKMILASVIKTPGMIMTLKLCGRKVWAGFLDGSLRIYERKGRLEHELPLEFQSEVTAIAFTGRHVWSAADMNLCIWDKNYKSVKKINTGNYIYCMLVVGNLMWIGTESSIQRWDLSTVKHVETLKLDPPRLVSSMVMIDREVWSTSSDSRVAVWNAETGQAVKTITTQGDVFSLSCGGASVWMGTTEGIVVHDKVTKDLTHHTNSPQAIKTQCLCETKVGDKWLVWSGNVQGEIFIWRTDSEKSNAANKITNKKKQIVTSSWQQLLLILGDINLLGMTGDAQEVFDAITVLDRQISNL